MKKVDIPLMTSEELDDTVDDLLFVKAWASAVEAEIYKALEEGANLKRAFLDPKRAFRKWVNEVSAENAILEVLHDLGRPADLDVCSPRKVLTPSAAQDLVGKRKYDEKLSPLVTAESSGYNLKLR